MAKIKYIIFAILFFFHNSTYSQVGSINVISGGSVPLIVTSMDQYLNGISLESWSRIRLTYNDPVPNTSGWILSVRAETSTIKLDGGPEEDDLDLQTIDIRAVHIDVVSGSYTGTAIPQTVALNSSYVPLLTDNQTSNIDLIITISYDLGKKPLFKVLGGVPGFYYVTLRYELVSID